MGGFLWGREGWCISSRVDKRWNKDDLILDRYSITSLLPNHRSVANSTIN